MRALLSFLIFIPLWAHGGELAETYKGETLKVLKRLQQNGVWQIACDSDGAGCLYTEDLIDDVSSGKVIWRELPDFNKAEGATRFSAFNAPQMKTIFLNRSVREIPSVVGLVGFHEVVELYGKNDRGFQVSTAVAQVIDFESVLRNDNDQTSLLLLDRIKDRIRRSSVPEDYFEPKEDRSLVLHEGGAVIGGGGGDTRTLGLRLEVFENLRKAVFAKHGVRQSEGPNGPRGGLSNPVSHFYRYYDQLPIDIVRSAGESVSYEFNKLKWSNIERVSVPENLLVANREAVVKSICLMYASTGLGVDLFSNASVRGNK